MANDYFYFKNLDIIGMLDDMESDFAKELQKLVKKCGGKLLRNVKHKTYSPHCSPRTNAGPKSRSALAAKAMKPISILHKTAAVIKFCRPSSTNVNGIKMLMKARSQTYVSKNNSCVMGLAA